MPYRLLAAFVAVIAVLETGIGATTVVPLTFSELVRMADTIVRVRVVDVFPEWRNGRAAEDVISTRVVFGVERVFKGTAGLTIALDFLGGTVGDVGLVVAGMPKFAVGEESILFLHGDQGMASPVVGFMQGRFRVTHSLDGTRSFVLTDDHRPFRSVAGIGAPTPANSLQPIPAMSLEAFQTAIASEVAAGRR